MEQISPEQKEELIDALEDRRVPFRQFWALSDIYFTDKVPTAGVCYSDKRIWLLVNPSFWNDLTPDGRLFVLCHEQMHIVMDHYHRLRFKDGDVRRKNVAADVSVNHMLIRNYDFEREVLPNWKKFCWVETVFPDQAISDNETAQFYYSLLRQIPDDELGGDPLDDHTGYGEIPDDIRREIRKLISDYVKEQTEGMSDQEREQWLEDLGGELSNHSQIAGVGFGSDEQQHTPPPRQSHKWKRIYKLIPKTAYKEKNVPQWSSRQRNHMLLPDDLILPSTREVDTPDIVRVHVYLDTSRSCIVDAKYFLESAVALPSKLFDIKLFGFTTEVYDINPNPPHRLRGFGGTSFHAVHRHVKQAGHLDAIIVFTDGHASTIHPEQPRAWHWFITPGGSVGHIDPRCHVYNLAELNWMC